MRPRIAMTASLGPLDGALRVHVPAAYAEAIVAGGGLPLVVPPLEAKDRAAECMEAADALLLVGGDDLSASLWGEAIHTESRLLHLRRQTWDLALVAAADARGLPVLGICLGCQEMAVHRGGRLVQHVYDDPAVGSHGGGGRPRAEHMVIIDADSALAALVGGEPLLVNSTHHQAVREPGRGMRVVAESEDGLVEAIEGTQPGRLFLGVQWHPETLHTEPRHLALFEALAKAAQAYRARQA